MRNLKTKWGDEGSSNRWNSRRLIKYHTYLLLKLLLNSHRYRTLKKLVPGLFYKIGGNTDYKNTL
jgi:hypothetical protein